MPWPRNEPQQARRITLFALDGAPVGVEIPEAGTTMGFVHVPPLPEQVREGGRAQVGMGLETLVEAVGVLMPLEQPQAEPTIGDEALAESAWDELVRLGQEICRGWRSPLAGEVAGPEPRVGS